MFSLKILVIDNAFDLAESIQLTFPDALVLRSHQFFSLNKPTSSSIKLVTAFQTAVHPDIPLSHPLATGQKRADILIQELDDTLHQFDIIIAHTNAKSSNHDLSHFYFDLYKLGFLESMPFVVISDTFDIGHVYWGGKIAKFLAENRLPHRTTKEAFADPASLITDHISPPAHGDTTMPRPTPLKILIVDDQIPDALRLHHALLGLGIPVDIEIVLNSKKAADSISMLNIDLVICDLAMPHMNSMMLFQQLHRQELVRLPTEAKEVGQALFILASRDFSDLNSFVDLGDMTTEEFLTQQGLPFYDKNARSPVLHALIKKLFNLELA